MQKLYDYVTAAKMVGVTWYTLKSYIGKYGITPVKGKGKNYLTLQDVDKLKTRDGKWLPGYRAKNVRHKKIGFLTAVQFTGEAKQVSTTTRYSSLWVWKCACGKRVEMSLDEARTKKSCGCKALEAHQKTIRKNSKKLGLYKGTIISVIDSKKVSAMNTTGIKGVCYNKNAGKYAAYISVAKKRISLGCYDNIDDAAKARRKAEKQYFKPIIEKYKSKTRAKK